jgi:hypothetical protein
MAAWIACSTHANTLQALLQHPPPASGNLPLFRKNSAAPHFHHTDALADPRLFTDSFSPALVKFRTRLRQEELQSASVYSLTDFTHADTPKLTYPKDGRYTPVRFTHVSTRVHKGKMRAMIRYSRSSLST